MNKILWMAALAVVLIGGLVYVAIPAQPAQVVVAPASWHPAVPMAPEYVGARDGCRRCHLKEFRSWEDTPHATAIEKLEGDDASNPECLKCHTTGMGEPGGFVSMADTEGMANVQCEACHGPGSEYRDRDVMKDRDASVAAGLVIPDASTCEKCHNEESPTFEGDFDFETMKEAGVHEISR
jgi:hypothetical protein